MSVKDLPARWRAAAHQLDQREPHSGSQMFKWEAMARVYRLCAMELEQARAHEQQDTLPL